MVLVGTNPGVGGGKSSRTQRVHLLSPHQESDAAPEGRTGLENRGKSTDHQWKSVTSPLQHALPILPPLHPTDPKGPCMSTHGAGNPRNGRMRERQPVADSYEIDGRGTVHAGGKDG